MLAERERRVKTEFDARELTLLGIIDFHQVHCYMSPMKPGTIVEYISRKEIVCGVVLAERNQRVQLLTEHNKEASHGVNRLAHFGNQCLDLGIGRDGLVEQLRAVTARRRHLQNQINVEELWEVLHTEATWIDLPSMAEFCFDGQPSEDHTSAVMRAMFEDRLYFKFDTDRFFPNSPEQVARIAAQAAEEARKAYIIEDGSTWVQQVMERGASSIPPDKEEIVEILKSAYLFGKESPDYKMGKEILSRANLDLQEGPFHLLVKLGVWSEDENLNLHRFGISDSFPPAVTKASEILINQAVRATPDSGRRDLSHLLTLTIDGQGTLDFDDAISIEPKAGGYRLGIHITDVSHFLKRGDPIDEEALGRASSIYMPDKRIPMLPGAIAEDLCSLRKGQKRFAISVMVDLDDSANVEGYEIFPSLIRVCRQLTYYEANLIVQKDPELSLIHDLARRLRKARLKTNALQLILPEMNVRVDEHGEISVTRINRESPSRVMVSECMILANWLTARFFRHHGQPTIYRSQLPARQHLIGENGGSLYQNWMQRRFLSRLVLDLKPGTHAGLGLDAYVTSTSPLRKYLDLVTQRQLRGLFGMERLYSDEELTFITQSVKQPMSYISVLQKERTRYWILKYLESFVGMEEEALVLEKRRQRYVVLLTKYMMECSLPSNSHTALQPEERVNVKIERVNARSDTLTVSLV